ncbi:MAG: Ig-like domain-containing protein, partial [Thermoplasmata archaeon]|nr:Ig-like domain-containing protein [Thermoplasmata archaeon]
LPDGDLGLAVRATDVNGTRNSSSVSIVTDNTDPSIRINAPKKDAVVQGNVPVRATVDEPNLLEVEADLGTGWEPMTRGDNGVWTIVWDSTAEPDGTANISVRAEDVFGHDSIALVEVTVDNVNRRPTIMLDEPRSGIVSGTIAVIAVVSDDRGIGMVSYKFGNITGMLEEDEPNVYHGIIDTTVVEDGIYELRVRVEDTDTLAASETVVLEVDNEVDPVYDVSIVTEGKVSDRSRETMTFEVRVTNEGNTRMTFSMSANNPAGVGVFFSDDELTLDPGDDGTVTVSVVPLEAGMYRIRVTVEGGMASDDVTLQVVVPEKGEDDGDALAMALGGLLVVVVVSIALAWYMGWLPSSARSKKP